MLIDIPKNVQQARTQPVFPKEVHLRGYKADCRASDIELNEIIGLIEKSERPVLYIGGGIITANASDELRKWFHHEAGSWGEFEKKYKAELAKKKELVSQLNGLVKEHGTVTLLFGSKDEKQNQAVVLAEMLKKTR